MSESWKDQHIEWYADEMQERGYLFNEHEWERFVQAMEECAREFFVEIQIEDEFIASLRGDGYSYE